jgi:hypothetical protein
MKMALLDKLFTVKEVAELLHVTDARIRQICINQQIGTKAGRDRFLSASDIDLIREYRSSVGIRIRRSDPNDN